MWYISHLVVFDLNQSAFAYNIVRSRHATGSKISLVPKQHIHLRGPKRVCNWRAVDRWIDELLGSRKWVNETTNFAFQDAEEVALVSFMFYLYFYCSNCVSTSQLAAS